MVAGRHPRFRVVPAGREHAAALAALQRTVFPNLGPQELMSEEHFSLHQEVFPEGEFVALALDDPTGAPLPEELVVGLGSGFLVDFDLQKPNHSFREMIAGGTYANHDPEGEWYYGADISVHPAYRGFGVGRALYDARKALVRRLKRRGIVAGGQLPGYPAYKDTMSLTQYVEAVIAGELTDPTLTFQLVNDFEVYGLIEGYLEDEFTDDWASFIVWFNPDLIFPEF